MATQMRRDIKTTSRDRLTPRQRQMYDIIKSYIKSNSYSPSYEELKQLIGSNSKSHVHGLVHQLSKRGWIKFANGRNRSISLV